MTVMRLKYKSYNTYAVGKIKKNVSLPGEEWG